MYSKILIYFPMSFTHITKSSDSKMLSLERIKITPPQIW